VLAAVQ
jgi:ATP-dependent DNA helicase Q4